MIQPFGQYLRPLSAALLLVAGLVAGAAQAARPKPGLEVITLPGSDAEYLVDRARNLCFFRSGGALTPVDCERVLGAPAPVAAPVAPKPPELGRGVKLAVNARPRARVTIDGVAVGATPLALEVGPGEHRLELVQDDVRVTGSLRARRGEAWAADLDVDRAEPLLWVRRTAPKLTARDLGKGANVVLLAWPAAAFTIDGVPVGTSPRVVVVGPGVHEVQATGPEGTVQARFEAAAGDELRADARGARREDGPLEVTRLRP